MMRKGEMQVMRYIGCCLVMTLWAFAVTPRMLMAQEMSNKEIAHVLPPEGKAGEEFNDVAKELRCPTCTGLSVLESDAPFSLQIKQIVKDKVEKGETKAEIIKFFVDRYGPWILRAPPAQGFNAVAWALPIALLVLGPVAIWFFVWRRRKAFETFGTRSTEEIVREMNNKLAALRQAIPGRKGASG